MCDSQDFLMQCVCVCVCVCALHLTAHSQATTKLWKQPFIARGIGLLFIKSMARLHGTCFCCVTHDNSPEIRCPQDLLGGVSFKVTTAMKCRHLPPIRSYH